MGNPTFYFYPTPNSGQLVKIDLQEGLGELSTDWEISAEDATSIDGQTFRSCGLHRQVITIQRDRMIGSEALSNKLQALQNHLDRGYSCSFSVDSDKAWIAPAIGTIYGGLNWVNVWGNPFRDIIGNNVPSNGDYLAIETESPGVIYEVGKKASGTISAINGGTITFEDYNNFTITKKAFVRWYRFWPIMKRPRADIGVNITSNESGLLWNLSIRLVTDSATLFRFHAPDGSLDFNFPGSSNGTEGGLTADFEYFDIPDFASRNEFEIIERPELHSSITNPKNWVW